MKSSCRLQSELRPVFAISSPLRVSLQTSSTIHFRDVTGGVYKTRERIHRGMLIRDY